MTTRPKVICLTPVKNEAWILESFLTAASEWADHIIIADQGSNDGSRGIALRFPKVEVLENLGKDLNEAERQSMLIEASRRIPGPRLLVALDADEFLTANFSTSEEWDTVLNSSPGTVLFFQWACVLPDRKRYYVFPAEFPLGLMDDGTPHEGDLIHGSRLPFSTDNQRIMLVDIKVLHLSITDWSRFKSKVRWYQTWEFLKGRWEGRLVEMYRFYHGCFVIPESKIYDIPNEWTDSRCVKEAIGGICKQEVYQWDVEMLRLIHENGTNTLRKLAIWEADWELIYQTVHGRDSVISLVDPRSIFERVVQYILRRTQVYYSIFPARRNRVVRFQEALFRKILYYYNW